MAVSKPILPKQDALREIAISLSVYRCWLQLSFPFIIVEGNCVLKTLRQELQSVLGKTWAPSSPKEVVKGPEILLLCLKLQNFAWPLVVLKAALLMC